MEFAEQEQPLRPMSALRPRRPSRLALLWVLLAGAAIVVCVLKWGGYFLIASDPLPAHFDAAVVLQGSTLGEKARVAGAMNLLQQRMTEHILLALPRQTYWDEPAQPAAHAYLERNYGVEATRQVYFCEVGGGVNSTEGEAQFLARCIQEHGWKSVVVVTSNYHSRRAGMLWRRMLHEQHSGLQIWVDGVPDPEFEPKGWWHRRLYAKTWFFEFSKLIWSTFS
jgi:uncharacterized SAM-binding protein YcdF (DUF218 family)